MTQTDFTSDQLELQGLSDAQVQERIQKGLVNHTDSNTGMTVGQIIRSNTFTYFNFIFLVIAILLCLVGSFRNLTFLPVIIINTLVGIIQEIRAKRTLEKMSILNAPHAAVIRNGTERKIVSEELVQDDVIRLEAGDQICADAVVLAGSVQVNESLLTGEADEIEKNQGSHLLSGSFVVAGQCYARLEKVGEESYISRLSMEAKSMDRSEQSEMIRSINQIVKWVGIVIIPIGLILFNQGYFLNGESIKRSVTAAVAAVIGMIPEGLYLLTTIALALGTIRLATKKVLLHDMKSIETLSRVDVLCVDKTGTITEPDMSVEKVLWRKSAASETGECGELQSLLLDYIAASQDHNATMEALRRYAAGRPRTTGRKPRRAVDAMPFSSAVKYGSVTFTDGVYLLGAPECIMQQAYDTIASEVATYTQKGYRVLLFARYRGGQMEEGLPAGVIPLGYLVLANPIRENAKQTFDYFKTQDVQIKVISGDNPKTVSEVALQAGIAHAEDYIDATLLDTDGKLYSACEKYTVFGRVTPKQKQKLVKALQKAGHTVAMTGDGVNDILAMKDADCSVAMASGSEAATQAAQVVLLDSDFARMPEVVFEGRRVVNNIQRSASLFLVKNIFSLLMSVFSAVFMITYPLEPSQISLIAMFTIGIPGFLLALEPNKDRIQGNFLRNVLVKALPAGLTDALAVGALVACGQAFHLPEEDIATVATLLLAVVGFMILIKISKPLTRVKYGIVIGNMIGLILTGIFLPRLFALKAVSRVCVLLLVVFAFAAESLFRHLGLMIEKIDRKI